MRGGKAAPSQYNQLNQDLLGFCLEPLDVKVAVGTVFAQRLKSCINLGLERAPLGESDAVGLTFIQGTDNLDEALSGLVHEISDNRRIENNSVATLGNEFHEHGVVVREKLHVSSIGFGLDEILGGGAELGSDDFALQSSTPLTSALSVRTRMSRPAL